MLQDYLKSFLVTSISILVSVVGLGIIPVIYTEGKILKYFAHVPVLIIAIVTFLVVVSYITHRNVDHLGSLQRQLKEVARVRDIAEKDAQVWKGTVLERSSGFPSLVNTILEYEKARDEDLANALIDKQRPAKRAAEIIREEAGRRREAEFLAKTAQGLIDYYESIAPFLIDLRNDVVDTRYDEDIFREYDEEERQDPVINYLTKEEYRKLSTVERNQLALDRFWKRPKSKRLLGRLYERYVGYLYEIEGHDVEYVGIFKGYEDLGRDLICRKGNDFVIIQCKNWSQFKTIYEKHIFQFFGTVFQYRHSYPDRNVRAVFCTTTQLSELARTFAEELDIELKEDFRFNQSYPCIKCNVNLATKERIYHLPFDQQYDKTKIVRAEESYCSTVKEAEEAGFRRALRWRGKIGQEEGHVALL